MIKVVFTYRTKTEHVSELFEKFSKSANPKFKTEVQNKGIEMFRRDEGKDTYIVLEIYYTSEAEYQLRTKEERSFPEWNEIWFNEKNKHEEVSVQVFEVIRSMDRTVSK